MPTRALTNLNYVVDQDSSVAFESPIIDLEKPIHSLSYQFRLDPTVRGIFKWYASIYPDLWEVFVACSTVDYVVEDGANANIIALPNAWLTVGRLKFVWTPTEGVSTGNISVAVRIVPI